MKIGFICGAFDLLHAGHINILKQCKENCDFLIVGLHVNPSIERESKNKPIESLLEREIRLIGCRYVDQIIVYETEDDLKRIFTFNKIDIRFLGSDYLENLDGDNKPITDKNTIPIKYLYSLDITSSNLRERIKNL